MRLSAANNIASQRSPRDCAASIPAWIAPYTRQPHQLHLNIGNIDCYDHPLGAISFAELIPLAAEPVASSTASSFAKCPAEYPANTVNVSVAPVSSYASST